MKKIAIAPMLDWTDRHYRYFMRQFTHETELYTEMIVADAILHGNQAKLLEFSPTENPLVVQLGGSDPTKLAKASKICEQYGYTAINLNVGCPSNRVKSGNFGACLMHDINLVSNCLKAMQDNTNIPITIKHRIGIDYNYNYDFLQNFVAKISETGVNKFIIHARNAVLTGLSPKENREIPPLKYEFVYKLKKDFPNLNFMLNGKIKTIHDILTHLQQLDGVMIGREAYYNPYLFHNIDNLLFGNKKIPKTRPEIAHSMLPYLIDMHKSGTPLHKMTKHMLGLFHGCPNAKLWRYTLTQQILITNSISTYEALLEKL